jgi:hypothetical protein
MKNHFYSLLIALIAFIPMYFAGCSSDEPQVIEMNDEAIEMYNAVDQEFQKSAGEKYEEK